MLDDLQLDQITDPQAWEVIQRMLNLIETLSAEVDRLKAETLQLRDENNRLKGEQGRPPAADISSKAERRILRGRVRQLKNDQIAIDREVPCPVDPTTLPSDAQFKGTVPVIMQDLVLRTDNIRFLKEKWYAPSTRQTYLGPLLAGHDGAFGPSLKSLAWLLTNIGHMSQPKLLKVVRAASTHIPSGHLVLQRDVPKRVQTTVRPAPAGQAAGLRDQSVRPYF